MGLEKDGKIKKIPHNFKNKTIYHLLLSVFNLFITKKRFAGIIHFFTFILFMYEKKLLQFNHNLNDKSTKN